MDRTELQAWLDAIPNQGEGRKGPSAFDDGEASAYREFFVMGLARPGDETCIESACAWDLKWQLKQYLTCRNGKLHWRIPLEWDISATAVVLRHDPQGPDYDAEADKRCFKDHNWKRIKAYCRLYRER